MVMVVETLLVVLMVIIMTVDHCRLVAVTCYGSDELVVVIMAVQVVLGNESEMGERTVVRY